MATFKSKNNTKTIISKEFDLYGIVIIKSLSTILKIFNIKRNMYTFKIHIFTYHKILNISPLEYNPRI